MATISADARDYLQKAADDGSFDVAHWPAILQQIVSHVDHVIHSQFPVPAPLPAQAVPQASARLEDIPSSPPEPQISDNGARQDSLHPSDDSSLPERKIPAPLLSRYDDFKKQLTTQFPTSPPHTLQRLAELVLFPRKHYRYLPSYLNALDKAVTVSSGVSVFPLPIIDHSATTIVNGSNSAPTTNGSHHDENVGGALLTPISWLRPESTSSPSAMSASSPNHSAGNDAQSDSEPTRQSGGVTQGELLRQEQENSDPPAPVASLASRPIHTPEGMEEELESQIEETEQPHARGPEEITNEDIGPQDRQTGTGQTLDIAAAVGRAPPKGSNSDNDDVEMGGTDSLAASNNANDSNGDTDGDGIDVAQADAILAREKRQQKEDEKDEARA